MNVLIAPDSYKESLSAKQVAEAMALGVQEAIPEANCSLLPFSDGGEGAFEVLETLNLGKTIQVKAQDPLGRTLVAPYFDFTNSDTVWIELSQASGLALLKPQEQNPLYTSTFGTGLQIKHAIEAGKRSIILGIGGSATHDVASGIFTALGGKLFDINESELKACGLALQSCVKIDTRELLPQLEQTTFTVACDVSNPLTGPNGAAHIYAKQKGANPDTIILLEKATQDFGNLLERHSKKHIITVEGAGAAGGTAAGMLAFTHAELKNGFDILADLTNITEKIKQADLIITGEGRTDEQSQFGKVPFRIAELAERHQKPVLLYSGGLTASEVTLRKAGFKAAFALKTGAISLEYAKSHAFALLQEKVASTINAYI